MISLAGWLVVALVAQTPEPTDPAQRAQPVPAPSIWTDAHGNPVSFPSDAEIIDYLKTARVVSEKPIGIGINQSTKLLEKDGVEIHAVFRDVEIERRHAKIGERVHQIFRDSYRYEAAAYELGRLLGLDFVPPVVPRAVKGRRGSVQIWLAPTLDETAEDFRPPDAGKWARQLWTMHVFDNLIFNIDRNAGNILVDSRYKVWMIDHTRAFQIEDDLLDESIARVDRRLWERLVSLSDDEIREAVKGHLDNREIESLLERRVKLVEHIRRLVSERGAKVILY